jgi:hypothetical protein
VRTAPGRCAVARRAGAMHSSATHLEPMVRPANDDQKPKRSGMNHGPH